MLKDNNIDPTLMGIEKGEGSNKSQAYNYLIGNNTSMNTYQIRVLDSPDRSGIRTANTPRSSHKVVTPLRKQNSSFLVASLESLFSDSQGVSEQIAKISTNASAFKSPASNLACKFASMCAMDNLSDPSLLQSHVQKSLEGNSIGLESTKSQSNMNSLYNTPIRCKQSRSHDFSELPSQQRINRRRSSILVQEDEDLLSILSTIDSNPNENKDMSVDYSFLNMDLSNFKDNEDDLTINVITNNTENNTKMITKLLTNSESESEEYNCFDESDDEVNGKRSFSKASNRAFNLPSPKDYEDGSKPPFSYASLIAQAIISSEKQRLALSNIYSWIMDTYPYYKSQGCGWQNSIRHNLSLNKCFKKIPRDNDEPGKGAYWTVDLDEMDDFEDGMFKRRRSSNSNICTNSQVPSILNSPSCNNAFVNGTTWSPSLLFTSTPQKTQELRTPHKSSGNVQSSVGPLTPLTSSSAYQQFKTPIKQTEHNSCNVTLTPKVAKSSPYTNLIPKTNTATSAAAVAVSNNNPSSAMFWSYPNLSLSQMGLDAEPPLADSEVEPIFCNNNISTSMDNVPMKLPELFKASAITTTTDEKDVTRMSPLSWLLTVSSQDTSLGLFDQSQQILSEYLSYNMN